MAGEENLVSFRDMTAEQQRKIASMGGKASQAKAKKRKALREQAELLLSLPLQKAIYDEKTGETMAQQISALTGIREEDLDNQLALLAVRFLDALNKNSSTSVQSYNCLIDAVGEKKTSLDINGGLTVNFDGEGDIED